MAACVSADALLRQCSQLLELSWVGQHLPTVYPLSLHWLHLDLSKLAKKHQWKPSRTAATDLTGHLAKLPHLQHLTLLLSSWGHLPSRRAEHLFALHCSAVPHCARPCA